MGCAGAGVKGSASAQFLGYRGRVGLRRVVPFGRPALTRRRDLAAARPLAVGATRARGEPAWHRRARRARGDARALARVAAARHLLRGHHSAQRGGAVDHLAAAPAAMPHGGGGGGLQRGQQGEDDAQLVSVAQLRRLLGIGDVAIGGGRGSARAGTGGGGGGGGGRRASQPRRGRQAQAAGGGDAPPSQRGGDWACGGCSFATNFSWRARCFRCGKPRGRNGDGAPAATTAVATTARAAQARAATCGGPIGAGGSRPLLSSFSTRAAAAAAGAPTYRPPGASVAGRAAAAAADASAHAADGGRPRAASHVASMPTPAAVSGGASVGNGADVAASSRAPPAVAASVEARGGADAAQRAPRWADDDVPWDRRCMDEDSDGYQEADAAYDDRAGDDAYAEDGRAQEAAPSPEQLREAWHAEVRAVKALEAQGCHAGSAALAAARKARDDAEAQWRCAIGTKPVSVRMGRAQQRLDKAARMLERCRLDLEAYDDEVEKRRAELRRRVDDAEERYRARSAQLDDLHAEAGELAAGSAAAHASRRANEDVCDMVAAELQAIADTLCEGSDTRGRVNLLLAKMASACGDGGPRPQSYHIGGDDGDCDDDQMEGIDGYCTGGSGGGWKEDAHGRWNRRSSATSVGEATDAGGDGWLRPRRTFRQPASQPRAGAGSAGGAAAPGGTPVAGHGAGQAAAGATATAAAAATASAGAATTVSSDACKLGETPASGRKREGEGTEEAQPPKSHRGDDVLQDAPAMAAADDESRARQLQHEQAIAIWAAQNAQSMFGDDTSRAIVGQLYAHKVHLAEQRAKAVGLPPKDAAGKSLIDMEPEELTAWVQGVLEPYEKDAKEL